MKLQPALPIFLILLLSPIQIKSNTWSRLDVQCLPEDIAFDLPMALTERQCIATAASKSDVGTFVTQYNKLTSRCTLFLFQSACRQMVAAGESSSDCIVIVRFPIRPQSISPKLQVVWLGDSMSRFDNLVCQSDPDINRFFAVGGVQWSSSYGADFDGSTGYLVVRKGKLTFDKELTWLLRLKRQPQGQPYIDLANCSYLNNSNDGDWSEFWERYQQANCLYARTIHMANINSNEWNLGIVLTSNSNVFVDIGLVVPPGSDYINFYYNGTFAARSVLTQRTWTKGGVDSICLYFGWRFGSTWRPKGTLRAIGMSIKCNFVDIH